MASSTQRRKLLDVAPGRLVAPADGLGRRRVLEQAPEEPGVVTAAGEIDRPAVRLGRRQLVEAVGWRRGIPGSPTTRDEPLTSDTLMLPLTIYGEERQMSDNQVIEAVQARYEREPRLDHPAFWRSPSALAR
jgi:hypothetical protein